MVTRSGSVLRFLVGGGLGVGTGFVLGNLLSSSGATFAVASGVGYCAGAVVNYLAQSKLGNFAVDEKVMT